VWEIITQRRLYGREDKRTEGEHLKEGIG